ncbi:MAG: DUF2442 domain-containing protein [Clostridiales Family XIII bacterium]|jgi:hypothetical protein|nr:DUF2442 domain-containing protein [Clostridiales Family XIII bacterium]
MRPRAIAVEPQADYKVLVTFSGNEKRLFDVAPYLVLPAFKGIKELFNTVHVAGLSIAWENGVDICPDELYYDSIQVSTLV